MALSVFADIEWLEKEYDFGTFKEVSGPVTGRVRFVNKGPDATFISRVRPSCGCTGASYTEKMIQPGDTAVVEFTYNPIGRPGRFEKSVRIYVGSDNRLTTVRISGTVIGSESTLETIFPYSAGSLRYETDRLMAGEVKRGIVRHLFLNVYNQSADTVRPSLSGASESLAVDVVPAAIPPGETGTVRFSLNTAHTESNGPADYIVGVFPSNDRKDDSFDVSVRAIVVADTDKMSVAEIEGGPRAYLVPEFVDFGDIEKRKSLDFVFDILNDGKSDMKVDRVYSSSSLVSIKKVPEKIKAGRQASVKGKLDIGMLSAGPFRIRVEVMTDDPIHPIRTANLVGNRLP